MNIINDEITIKINEIISGCMLNIHLCNESLYDKYLCEMNEEELEEYYVFLMVNYKNYGY